MTDYYNNLFGKMAEAVLIINASKQSFYSEFLNSAGKKLFDLTSKGGVRDLNFIQKKFKHKTDYFTNSIKTCLEQNASVDIEIELIDNPFKCFDITISPIQNSSKPESVICIIKDVSEKKKAENKLNENKYMFEQFLEFSPFYVFFKDENIRAIALSKNYEKMLNMPLDKILGKTMEELFPSSLAKSMIEDDKKILRERKPFEINEELDNRHYYTVKFPIRRNEDSPLMLAGFTMDITDFVVTEKALRESEERFKTAFLTSPDSVNINRLSDGKYIDINDGFTKLTGWTRDDVIGKSSLEMNIWVNSEDRERLVDGLKKTGYYENLEADFRFKNGKIRTGLMSARIIRLGNEPCILSITRDITHRKVTEKLLVEKNKEYKIINEELTRAKEKAEESDRLKSAFLANMSHEIRTPLNAIMGFSDLLEDPDIEVEKIPEYTKVIKQRGEDLLRLINDILDLSKIESNILTLQESNTSLTTLFNELHQTFSIQAKRHEHKSLEIKFSIPDNPHCCIITDKNRLRQILINLLDNAIKYTDSGLIEYGYNINEEEITFFVKDTGVGIPEDKKALVFERFRQIDNVKITRKGIGGTGLGLSISKGLVELMDGKIWVESELDKGSTFYFSLPYQEGEVIASEEDEERTKSDEYPDKCILIVEDDHYNAEYLTHALKNTKAKQILVKDGKSALNILNSEQSVDLALVDILLPDVSGYEIIEKIRTLRPDATIIAQTAFASQYDESKCYDAGAHGFLAKPISLEQLYTIISRSL